MIIFPLKEFLSWFKTNFLHSVYWFYIQQLLYWKKNFSIFIEILKERGNFKYGKTIFPTLGLRSVEKIKLNFNMNSLLLSPEVLSFGNFCASFQNLIFQNFWNFKFFASITILGKAKKLCFPPRRKHNRIHVRVFSFGKMFKKIPRFEENFEEYF